MAPPAETGDEHTARVDTLFAYHVFDHLADGGGFAPAALGVLGLKPVEAAVRIVGSLLLGHQQSKAIAIRQCRPSGAVIVTRGRLTAAMQHNDQCRMVHRRPGHMAEHSQFARIGAEALGLFEADVSASQVRGAGAPQRFERAKAVHRVAEVEHRLSSFRTA